jgi:hypothetical protein
VGTADQTDLDGLRRVGEAIDLETRSPWFLEYQQLRAEITGNSRAQVMVLEQAALAVQSWATAHRDMAAAIQQRRPPALAELHRMTEDLLDLYKQARFRH